MDLVSVGMSANKQSYVFCCIAAEFEDFYYIYYYVMF